MNNSREAPANMSARIYLTAQNLLDSNGRDMSKDACTMYSQAFQNGHWTAIVFACQIRLKQAISTIKNNTLKLQ